MMIQILKKLNLTYYIPLTLLCFAGAFYYLKSFEDTVILFTLVIVNHFTLIGMVTGLANSKEKPSSAKLYIYLLLKLAVLGAIFYFLKANNQYLWAFVGIFIVQVVALTVSLKKD